MMSKQFITTALILPLVTGFLYSQTFLNPNSALKSHETLEIKKITAGERSTLFYMSIENRIENGYFCADKNIFIIYPDGKRVKMISSGDIPNCPDIYRFKSIGEKLDFILTFPPLESGTEWVDLIEECSENCFSFYGVTLDNNLNKRIDDSFLLAENKDNVNALNSFISILGDIDEKNHGVVGLLYINIIRLSLETGNTGKAEEWYNRLKSSSTPRLSLYLKYLEDIGIRY